MDTGPEKARMKKTLLCFQRMFLLCFRIYVEGEREVTGHFQVIHPSNRSPESPLGRQIIVIKCRLVCILASLLVLEWSNLKSDMNKLFLMC